MLWSNTSEKPLGLAEKAHLLCTQDLEGEAGANRPISEEGTKGLSALNRIKH